MSAIATGPRRILKNRCAFWVSEHRYDFWDRVENDDWEPLTYRIFDRFLDAGSSCLDIGAWIGPTALYAASLARHCYALEPDPVAFAALRENVALNPSLAGRITILQQCLAPASGPVRIGNRTSPSGGDSMSSLLFASSSLTWEADGVAFEDLLEANNIRDCNFIKMDIEGGEFDLLPSISAYLTAHRPTLHLSLHPNFVSDPDARMPAIRDALSCYRHALTPEFRPISLDTICDPATFNTCYELLLTDLAA